MSCTGITCNHGRAGCEPGCDNHAPTARRERSCAELGVCQSRTPPCSGDCHRSIDTSAMRPGELWFVPGFTDEPPPPEPLTWLQVALIAVAGSGAVGLLAGIAWGVWKGLL